MSDDQTCKIFEIISDLQISKISFSLEITREDAITVLVAVPGQRWEIDVFKDGEVDVEVFRSNGDIFGREQLSDMIKKFSD